jgi:hypothetical protein
LEALNVRSTRVEFALLVAGLAMHSAPPALVSPAGTRAEDVAGIRATPRTDCGTQVRAADEIVVCGQRDRGEQYRVPKILRDRPPGPQGTAWGAKMRELDEDMRNRDTVTGLGGPAAHHRQWLREWRAERDEIARTKAEQKSQIEANKAGK